MANRNSRFFWLIVLAALLPATAQAHLSGVKVDDFWLGILHPLVTLEDAAAFIAIGLLAGCANETRGLKIVTMFSAVVGIGAVLAINGISSINVIWVMGLNLASLVVIGGLVALAAPLPLLVLLGIAIVFGLPHGFANGAEALPPVKPWLFTAGLVVSAFLLPFYAMLAVIKLKPWWTRIAVRVVGSWIAAIGLLVLALSFAKASGRV